MTEARDLPRKPSFQQLTAPRPVNGGHDRAYLARDSGPDGSEIVEHEVVTTGRMADRLYDRGRIDALEHQAATALRDAYERARLAMGKIRAVDMLGAVGAGGEPDLVSDEAQWRLYRGAMKACARWATVLRAIVIDDRAPRRNELEPLRQGLRAAVNHFGLRARR